ncbi:hypothetical protein P885DRAFT_28012 [Corynascus similis CBS 632.67]
MAESASKGTMPRPASLPTPSTPYTPSPLTPTGTRSRLGPRRQSRFTEDMTERTPVASVSERSIDYNWYVPSMEDVNSHLTADATNNCPIPNHKPAPTETGNQNDKARVRLVNSTAHATLSLVLLAFMGCSMSVLRDDTGDHTGVQAIILICILFADVVLDVITLLRVQKSWPALGLGLRFACGVAYIALFLIYVGMGGPFPKGHSYWSLSSSSASLLVYIILCTEGLWNLLHIPVCRYQLGSGLLRPKTRSSSPAPTLNDRTSFNPRFSAAGTETERSSISLVWRRWVRTRSTQYSREDLETGSPAHRAMTREASPDFTLREQPGEEEEEAGDSRAMISHDEKTNSGVKEKDSDKWHENGSEETVGPAVGDKDVEQ